MNGDYRHKIQIKKRDLVTDPLGGHSFAYSLIKEAWASIDEAGDQWVNADGLRQKITHRITMRKFNDYPIMHYVRMLTNMYIFHRGDFFRIVSVRNPDERGYLLELAAEQVKP